MARSNKLLFLTFASAVALAAGARPADSSGGTIGFGIVPQPCPPSCVPSCTPAPVSELNQPFANDFRVTLSADGLTIIAELTDRSVGGNSHLYQATRPERCGSFGSISPVCGVNSTGSDGQPWLSRDGLRLYFMSTRCSGGPFQCLYVASRADVLSCFGAPIQVPGLENGGPCSVGGPTLTADELTIFFTRHCTGGNCEVWTANRPTTVSPFNPPQPLAAINLAGFDNCDANLSSDGLMLYFMSNRPGSMGARDIWVARTTSAGGPFGPPVNVPCVNTSFNESWPCISPDGCELYFSTDRDAPSGNPRANIWRVFGPGTPGNRAPDCRQALADPALIWPPNHAFVPVTVHGVTDPDGDPVTITVTRVTQDEPLQGSGDGNTCPDALLTDAGGGVQVRAERSGNGNGRVYAIHFRADDGQGGSCDGSVAVCVPHDESDDLDVPHQIGGGAAGTLQFTVDAACRDDGQAYNSVGSCARPRHAKDAAVPDIISAAAIRSGNAATLEYHLPAAANVFIGVYDVAGRRMATLLNGPQEGGVHQLTWSTGSLERGIYFYRMRAGRMTVSRALLILK